MLKIAICDDLKEDCERVYGFVQNYLKEKSIPAEVRTFQHPDSMIEDCEKFRAQIYILDIMMPMVTGIEAARELRWNQPDAQIVFASSEKGFALESFAVNPLNYILKPVQQDSINSTLDLAISRVKEEWQQFIVVKIKSGYATLKIDEIMYIDYCNHVVTYHMYSGEAISTATMRIGFVPYMEENHKGKEFVRCHESIYVNVSAIDKLSKTEITLRSRVVIPVSKKRYEEVADRYMEFRL